MMDRRRRFEPFSAYRQESGVALFHQLMIRMTTTLEKRSSVVIQLGQKRSWSRVGLSYDHESQPTVTHTPVSEWKAFGYPLQRTSRLYAYLTPSRVPSGASGMM